MINDMRRQSGGLFRLDSPSICTALQSYSMRSVLLPMRLKIDFTTFVFRFRRQMDRSGSVSLLDSLSNDLYTLSSFVRYFLFISIILKFINYLFINMFKCRIIHQKNLCPTKKAIEPDPILKSRREPLLDDDTLQRLSRRLLFLYKVIMMQSVSTTYFSIAFSELLFYDGDAYVYVTDIIELFKDEWFNVSILQIFCM
jgi:hypothetical protein